jgi:23S rRNA A2030 N6-methylase RlmJ
MRLQTFGAGEYPMVFEGRGNGWLFPNAAIKIWLDADENVRFRRKHGDAERFGAVAYSDTVKSLSMRAGIEARNAIISAKPAPGAIRIDTTYMTEDEVLAAVLAIYNNKRRGFGWKSGVNIWLPILAKSKIILRRVVSRMEILADRLIYIMCQWPVRPQAA